MKNFEMESGALAKTCYAVTSDIARVFPLRGSVYRLRKRFLKALHYDIIDGENIHSPITSIINKSNEEV